MCKTHSTDRINKTIAKNYGDQISLAGRFWGHRASAIWYCHDCENWFFQNYASIYRGYKTRCKCNYSHYLDPERSRYDQHGARNTLGHRCLPEWEYRDRVIPPRPVKGPQDRP